MNNRWRFETALVELGYWPLSVALGGNRFDQTYVIGEGQREIYIDETLFWQSPVKFEAFFMALMHDWRPRNNWPASAF